MQNSMALALRRSSNVVFAEDLKIYHLVLHGLDLPPGTFMENARGSGKLDNAFP
jgi:hypothetical protein